MMITPATPSKAARATPAPTRPLRLPTTWPAVTNSAQSSRTRPPEMSRMSVMIPYPCWAPSASAVRIMKVASCIARVATRVIRRTTQHSEAIVR